MLTPEIIYTYIKNKKWEKFTFQNDQDLFSDTKYPGNIKNFLETCIRDFSFSEGGIQLDVFTQYVPLIAAMGKHVKDTLVFPCIVVTDDKLQYVTENKNKTGAFSLILPFAISMSTAVNIHKLAQEDSPKNCMFVLISAPRGNAVLCHASVVWLPQNELTHGRFLSALGDNFTHTPQQHKLPYTAKTANLKSWPVLFTPFHGAQPENQKEKGTSVDIQQYLEDSRMSSHVCFLYVSWLFIILVGMTPTENAVAYVMGNFRVAYDGLNWKLGHSQLHQVFLEILITAVEREISSVVHKAQVFDKRVRKAVRLVEDQFVFGTTTNPTTKLFVKFIATGSAPARNYDLKNSSEPLAFLSGPGDEKTADANMAFLKAIVNSPEVDRDETTDRKSIGNQADLGRDVTTARRWAAMDLLQQDPTQVRSNKSFEEVHEEENGEELSCLSFSILRNTDVAGLKFREQQGGLCETRSQQLTETKLKLWGVQDILMIRKNRSARKGGPTSGSLSEMLVRLKNLPRHEHDAWVPTSLVAKHFSIHACAFFEKLRVWVSGNGAPLLRTHLRASPKNATDVSAAA